MATADQAVSILNQLVAELANRQNDDACGYGVETLSKAYDGAFKLHYASSNFQEFFADRYKRFSDNWCGIVADAPHERLEVTGIRLDGETGGDDPLWAAWRRNDADALSDLAMLDAIVAKRSYARVWGDRDDNAVIHWGHPSQMIVGYDPATRARVSGAFVWADEAHDYAELDWAGYVWKFQRSNEWRKLHDDGFLLPSHLLDGGWKTRQPAEDDTWPIPNPMGKTSFVELPNRPRLRGEPHSDIAGTLAMQHAINLLWAQLFAVSDEATIGQRVITGAEQPMTPVLNADGEVVGEKPVDLKKLRKDNILWVTDPGAKPFEWQAANLKPFTDIIEIAVGHIAAQTRTPAHYLLIGGTVANVSADAMKALETGLVKRTEEKTQHFGRAVRDVFELVALAENDVAKAGSVRTGQVLWKDVENRSDAQRADALQKKSAIGYPLRYLLELDGLPPTEIERVMRMREAEQTDALTRAIVDGVNSGAAKPNPGVGG